MGMNLTELEDQYSKFANEYVAYIIIENAFRSIDNGDSVDFTIDIQHRANYVANPKVGNSFAQSINNADNQVQEVPMLSDLVSGIRMRGGQAF